MPGSVIVMAANYPRLKLRAACFVGRLIRSTKNWLVHSDEIDRESRTPLKTSARHAFRNRPHAGRGPNHELLPVSLLLGWPGLNLAKEAAGHTNPH